MGQFAIAFALTLVVLQSTVLLLRRTENSWRFWLIDTEPLAQHDPGLWNGIDIAFKNGSTALSVWWSNDTRFPKQQLACITNTINHSDPMPVHCLLKQHSMQRVYTVLATWNPHAILLTLCMIQLIMTMSKTQHHRDTTVTEDRNLHVPLGAALTVLLLILITVLLLTGIPEGELIQYPTLLTITALVLAATWFCWDFENKADDIAWNIQYHMQCVAVPLAVLSIATAGTRLWTDVFTHSMLLGAATITLRIQNKITDNVPLRLVQATTIALPSLSLWLAHVQWGADITDSWKPMVGCMGCAGLLPMYILSIFPWEDEKKKIRITHVCSGAGLLSCIVHLASLQHEA